jgi:hypothetical protein
MAIRIKPIRVHWNYFLALENDATKLARFVEFHGDNFKTFSIELAHLLMAASSEVDVIAKLVCEQIQPNRNPRNILNYASIILPVEPKLASLTVMIPRFGVTLRPWVSWTATKPPLWWTAYNNVKHQRDTKFPDANLGHCLNAMAGLFSLTIYYYALLRQRTIEIGDKKIKTANQLTSDSGRRSLMAYLRPGPELFTLRSLLGESAEKNEGSVPAARTNPIGNA